MLNISKIKSIVSHAYSNLFLPQSFLSKVYYILHTHTVYMRVPQRVKMRSFFALDQMTCAARTACSLF